MMNLGVAPVLSGESSPGPSVDFRGQLQEYRQRLSGQVASAEELKELLKAPLAILNVLPEQSSQYSGAGNFGSLLGAQRKPGRDHLWFADLQEILLDKVLIDWSESFEKDEKLAGLAQAWLSPKSSGTGSGCVHLASITSLTSHLMKLRASLPAQAQSTQLATTFRAIQVFLKGLSLPSIFAYINKSVPPTQQAFVWTTACRQLVTLPDRIANAFGANLPVALTPRVWHAKVLAEVEEAIWSDCDTELIGITLSRCIQSRWIYSEVYSPGDTAPLTALLGSCVERVNDASWPSKYKNSWATALQRLAEAEQDHLLENIVTQVDRTVLVKGGAGNLVTSVERQRPGAEGTSFMSPRLLERSTLIADLLGLFVAEAESSDDDEEDEDALERIIVSSSASAVSSAWTPAMARVLVDLLRQDQLKAAIRANAVLERAVSAWSKDVRKASDESQIYLTLVILLVIAILPDTSKAVSDVALSPDFLQGVSAHLEHLSPLVRRLGMLVAEVVAQKTGKNLSFGHKLWDGRGDGREEARVLRTAMLAFPSQATKAEISKEALLDTLDLTSNESEETDVQIVELSKSSTQKAPPKTQRLPRQVPAKGSGIQLLGGDGAAASDTNSLEPVERQLPNLFNVGNRPNLNPLIQGLASDSESASSSDSDSSDEEELEQEPNGVEEGKAFGMGVPGSKKKIRPPVYVGELATLLRSNERGSVRMGLRTAQSLVERKAGWGGEVHDNAINLALALIGLNNNFRIAKFEDRRTAALTALVVASPERVAPCLAEQYFVHQYSMAQRTSMLNALAFGARQLSSDEAQKKAQLTDNERGLEVLSRDLAQLAIARARQDGEANVPELQREKSLLINAGKAKTDDAKVGKWVAPRKAPYLAVAQRCFIFPLINRFWAYLQDSSLARKSRHLGSIGSSIIDMPFLVGAFLDTLAVLAYFAQHDPQFRQTVVPEMLELTLTISRPSLVSKSADDKDRGQEQAAGGSRATVLGAAASLVVLLLDAVWQLDGGYTLCSHHADLFIEVQHWAAAIFEVSDGGGGGASSADRSSIGPNERAARSSAAILLRVHEMRERRRGV